MLFEILKGISEGDNSKCFAVTHKGERLVVKIGNTWSSIGNGGVDIFAPLNEWLSTLPASKQDKMFKLYEKVWESSNIAEYRKVKDYLTGIVADIHKLIDWPQLREWSIVNSKPSYTDVSDSFNNEYDRPLTYIRNEYDDLVAMSYYFRLLLPIWANFITSVGSAISTAYKDIECYALMERSCVHDLEPMERLKVYTEATTDKIKKDLAPAVIRSFGTEEIPKISRARAIVRKLAVVNIRGESSLIIEVYRHITQNEHGFKSGVRDKNNTKSDGDEDLSIVENYRKSSMVTEGSIQLFESSMDFKLACRDLGIPNAQPKVEAYYEHIANSPSFRWGQHHYQICALVLSDITSIQLITSATEAETRLKMIANAAGWLSENGFMDLVTVLMSDYTVVDDVETTGARPNTVNAKAITKDTAEKLYDLYYPRDTDSTVNNEGTRWIELLCGYINNLTWVNPETVKPNFAERMAQLLIVKLGE